MAADPTQKHLEERRALLGLWAVPGIGSKSIEVIREAVGGDLAEVLRRPAGPWLWDLPGLPAAARTGLAELKCSIADSADRTREAAERGRMGIAYRGDPEF